VASVFSLPVFVKFGSRIHGAYPVQISDVAPKRTVEKHENDYSLSSNAKVKTAQIRSYLTSFPYALMVWYFIKERDGLYLSNFRMTWLMTFNEHVVNSPAYFSFIILSLTVTLFSGSSSFVSMRWFYFPTPACMLYLLSVI